MSGILSSISETGQTPINTNPLYNTRLYFTGTARPDDEVGFLAGKNEDGNNGRPE
jgi:hypothetical protein